MLRKAQSKYITGLEEMIPKLITVSDSEIDQFSN
jgi:hypothetical protein